MKHSSVDLHMEKNRALVLMLFFSFAYFLINLLAVTVMNKESAQLSSLIRSSYEYSATASKSVLQDDYYQFNAGISFSTLADSKNGINAEVLMQSNESQYSSSVDWNAKRLGSSGVALTKGIARSNNLRVGDKVYSSHIVDGTVHEYIIEQILPELSASRLSEKRRYTEGIIIMGFDNSYLESIAHTTLLYTNKPVDDVSTLISETPLNLIYRTDEMILSVKRLFPYLFLFSMLATLVTVILVILFTKSVKHNFRRFITLGFEEKKLNGAYFRLVFGVGIPTILIAFFISIIISNLFVFSFIELAFLLVILFAEFIILLILAESSKSRLWR